MRENSSNLFTSILRVPMGWKQWEKKDENEVDKYAWIRVQKRDQGRLYDWSMMVNKHFKEIDV